MKIRNELHNAGHGVPHTGNHKRGSFKAADALVMLQGYKYFHFLRV